MAPPDKGVSPDKTGKDNGLKVDETPLYFLLIDGMCEMDSAGFGGLLESRFKWKNLVNELDPAPEDKRRLVDAAHPFLIVRKIADPNGGSSVPVVDPCGECGFGTDRAWLSYSHDKPVIERSPHETKAKGEINWADQGHTTFGRHTAYEQSSRFVPTMLVRPRLMRREYNGASHWSFAEMDEDVTEARTASLVYVSSHGWLGGFMAGDLMQPSKAAEPDAAKEVYYPRSRWFLVGRDSTMPFQGPLWVILAQCSTLNSATWAMWARMMAGGSPVVRGILGYEEAAPGAIRSTAIVKKLCDKLQAGETFLNAWKQANTIAGGASEPWAAIVHNEALGDTMKDFRAFKALEANAPTDLTEPASYKGYLRSIPDGEDIRDEEPKFKLALWALPETTDPSASPGAATSQRQPITPEFLSLRRARIRAGGGWELSLSADDPDSGDAVKLKSARIEMVHIRRSYADQIPFASIFDQISVTASPKPDDDKLDFKLSKNVIEITCREDTEIILVTLSIAKSKDVLTVPHLQPDHSYLWWRVTLITEANADAPENEKTHEFRLYGLSR